MSLSPFRPSTGEKTKSRERLHPSLPCRRSSLGFPVALQQSILRSAEFNLDTGLWRILPNGCSIVITESQNRRAGICVGYNPMGQAVGSPNRYGSYPWMGSKRHKGINFPRPLGRACEKQASLAQSEHAVSGSQSYFAYFSKRCSNRLVCLSVARIQRICRRKFSF